MDSHQWDPQTFGPVLAGYIVCLIAADSDQTVNFEGPPRKAFHQNRYRMRAILHLDYEPLLRVEPVETLASFHHFN